MKRFATLLAVSGFLFVSACGAKAPTAELQTMKDKICACEDAACAGQIVGDLKALSDKYSSFEDETKAQSLITEAATCAMMKDMSLADKITEALK